MSGRYDPALRAMIYDDPGDPDGVLDVAPPPPPRRAEGGRRVDDAPKPQLVAVDAATFLQRVFDAPAWIVDGLVPAAGCTVLGGAPKSCKSWLALDLALAVASGQPFLGREITRKGSVLLIDCETPAPMLQERIRQLAAGRRIDSKDLANIHIVERRRIDVTNEQTTADLQSLVAEIEPVLIIADPLRELHAREENSSSELSPVLAALRSLTMLGAALLLVHHVHKGDATGRRAGSMLRGSSALWGWLDSLIVLRRDQDLITAGFEGRHTVDQAPLDLRLVVDEGAIVPTARIEVLGTPAVRACRSNAVMDFLERRPGGATQKDIATAIGASGQTVKTALLALEDAGLVCWTETDRYKLWNVKKTLSGT